MTLFVFAIVGLGPRGLTLLDRLIETYRWKQPDYQLTVHLVDPGDPGEGVHGSCQPDHLLVNTPGRMITMFPKEAIAGAPPREVGPSLPEWARLAGYRRIGSRYQICDADIGDEIGDEDYLPRGLLGKYLSWYFDRTVGDLPAGLSVVHNKLRATDAEIRDDKIVSVEFETGFRLQTDFVFVATGHGVNRPNSQEQAFGEFVKDNSYRNDKLLFYRDPYPLVKLADVRPEATVALQGCGLTAHDIIAELTVARGGEFAPLGDQLSYHKSGREPRLLLFSRSGLPFCARAVNRKEAGSLYKAHFFKPDAIAAIRDEAIARGLDGRLDFDLDVLPLLKKEMAYVYATTKHGTACNPSSYEPDDEDYESIERAMHPLRFARFNDILQFRQHIIAYLEADILDASLGNQTGPIKAAVEVIRDSRQCLRLAVEFCGLTAESHQRFDAHHQPMMNRLAFGPPLQRNRELLALIRAGVLDIAAGPSPTVHPDVQQGKFVVTTEFEQERHAVSADVLILGRIDFFRPLQDTSLFYRNLSVRGIVRPFCNGTYHPGGLDINRENHPLMLNGAPVSNMWVVGYPVEGAHFFTHALPLPLLNSRHVLDADRCVLELFEALSNGAQTESHNSSPHNPQSQLSSDFAIG